MVHPSDFELDQASDWELDAELASEYLERGKVLELLGSTDLDNMDLDDIDSGLDSTDSGLDSTDSGSDSMDLSGLGLGLQP